MLLLAETPKPSRPDTYRVDVWYRHVSDPDRSRRDIPQMSCVADEAAGIDLMIENLRRQDYTVQLVTVTKHCQPCKGNGRIARTFKRAPTRYRDCVTCKGEGTIGPTLAWNLGA